MASSCAQPLGESGSLPGACSTSSGEFMCSTSRRVLERLLLRDFRWVRAQPFGAFCLELRRSLRFVSSIMFADASCVHCSVTTSTDNLQVGQKFRLSVISDFENKKTSVSWTSPRYLQRGDTCGGTMTVFSSSWAPAIAEWPPMGSGTEKKGGPRAGCVSESIMIKQVTVLCEFRSFYFVIMDFQVWEFVFSYNPWWLVRTHPHQRQWLCLYKTASSANGVQKSWMDVNSKRILDAYFLRQEIHHLVHIPKSQNTSSVTKNTKNINQIQ